MFITEIVLKNIRSFTNEVKIDLNHNKKNIEQDLKEKKLFLRKNDVVYTPIVAIGGANAKGKTSTLEAISFIFDYFNYSTDDINLVINILKSLGFSNLFLDSKFTNIISDYSKNTLINYFLKLPFDNDIEFFVKEIKKWLYDK
ncbi:MAG: AAA family ATPase, partial [Malacoplasma sp.]|nr:AAA family ATPase [Malacoplasma sp.]